MAIVWSKGIPDVFLTFTCNPNWQEIIAKLEPDQTACDRPDFSPTNFKWRWKPFLKEWQKLDGLPKLLGTFGQGDTKNEAYLTSICSLSFFQSKKFPQPKT
jgi:hypothetical protein